MKLNNKGFMMAEVVVVSVIICTVLISLYTSLVRINEAYETRNRYYDINTLYFTEEVNYNLIASGYINSMIKNGNSIAVNLNNESINLSKINSFYNSDDTTIKMYFSLYSKDKVNNLSSLNSISNTFKDYIKYATGHFDFNENYNYMLITEMCKTKDDCYYYGLRVR